LAFIRCTPSVSRAVLNKIPRCATSAASWRILPQRLQPRLLNQGPRGEPHAQGHSARLPTQGKGDRRRSAGKSALDDRIFEPYGVRAADWISLSGCQQNRVQLTALRIGSPSRRSSRKTIYGGFRTAISPPEKQTWTWPQLQFKLVLS